MMTGPELERLNAGVLFIEDFDDPSGSEAEKEPEVIEPKFTAAQIAEMRKQAWQAGHEVAAAGAAAREAALARTLADKAVQEFAAAREQLQIMADENAQAVARLVFESFRRAFPALTARLGDEELRAVVHSLLSAFSEMPELTLRLNPAHAQGVARELAMVAGAAAENIDIVPDEALPPGDIQAQWRNGCLVRNAQAIWTDIMEILAPAGLAPAPTVREVSYVE